MVHFEESVGGAISIELDKNGKIIWTEVMIGRHLAIYNGKDAKPIVVHPHN